MKNTTIALSIVLLISFYSCKKQTINTPRNSINSVDFTIAFGSCNKQYKPNVLWKEIKKNNPDLWIWGGDNIYADTDDMSKMKEDYEDLKNQNGYLQLIENLPIMATWDDHDYGGLTHAYTSFISEPNQYRVQSVMSVISFGLLQFNFDKKSVKMQMRGENNKILQEINQVYP
jgi:phosphodiesterase/alkaline phosphatase D-like protein